MEKFIKNKYVKMVFWVAIFSIMYQIIINGAKVICLFFIDRNEAFKNWFMANELFYIIVNDVISLIVIYFLVKFLMKENPWERLRFTKLRGDYAIMIALIGLSAGLFTTSVLKFPFVIEKWPVLGQLMDGLLDGGTPIVFLGFLFIGSIYKESLFRGLYFNEFRKALPLWIALILQGLAYGYCFFGLNPALTAYGMLGCLLFAFFYLAFDSIWASYIAQVTSTGGMWLYKMMGDSFVNSKSCYITFVVSIVLLVVSIGYLIKNRKNLKARSGKSIAA